MKYTHSIDDVMIVAIKRTHSWHLQGLITGIVLNRLEAINHKMDIHFMLGEDGMGFLALTWKSGVWGAEE